MYNNQKITMVVPCYNEEFGLRKILNQLPKFIDEVIVVDNDSDDNTAQVAKEFGAQVVFEKQRGYGHAYQAGLSDLKDGEIVIMMDGDNTISTSDIEKFLMCMDKDGYDFLSGCRFPLIDTRAMPLIKRVSNNFFSWLIRRSFGINLIDSQSGFIVFRRCLLPAILSLNPGMGFGMELKLNAWLNSSIKCGELHINYGIRSGKVKYRALYDGMMTIRGFLSYFLIRQAWRNLRVIFPHIGPSGSRISAK